jgi:hypothetical protein
MLSIELVLLYIDFIYLNIWIILDIPKREDEDEQEEEDGEDDNKIENISDEGIEDTGTGSDSGTPPNDYLISSVSKFDIDLMSMLFIF